MPDRPAIIATEQAPLLTPFDDPECGYLDMPKAMQTFVAPLPEALRGEGAASGSALLRRLADALQAGENHRIDLDPTDRSLLDWLDPVLGRGEITVRMDAGGWQLHAQESVYAGVWRVRQRLGEGEAVEYLETGPLPPIVEECARHLTQGFRGSAPREFPEGVMNAPALLYEIFEKSARFRPGAEEVLNLSLLPLNAEDARFVSSALGMAGLSILSKGYGDCRIHLSRLPHVWWVQYFNATDQLILNSVEITDLPAVVPAAPEDLEDSAARIAETLAALD